MQTKPKSDNSIALAKDLRGTRSGGRGILGMCGYTSTPECCGNRVRAAESSDQVAADATKGDARLPIEESGMPSTVRRGAACWKMLPGQLLSGESGATLIEYTLLLSLVMLALLALIIVTGGWAVGMWTNFLSAVGA